MPRRREPFTFGRDEELYLALFSAASDEKRVGEASTQYLFSRRAPELIRDFQPAAKLVVMIRNPVDLAQSLHGQRLSMGVEQLEDFNTALAADLQPDFGGGQRRETIERAGTYRDRARMGEQLERWLEVFPRDRIHVIVLDDFKMDTPTEFRRLLEFLDVDPAFQPDTFAVHNPRHRDRQGVSRALMHNPVSRWLAKSALPAAVGGDRSARTLRRVRLSRLSVTRSSVTPVDPALRLQLEDEFGADVEKLGKLLGRDLRHLWFGAKPSPIAASVAAG